jgi:general nucleoside transport system permease protein
VTTVPVDADDSVSPPPASSSILSPFIDRLGNLSFVVGLYIVSIGGALLISAVMVEATGGSWSVVLSALLDGSIRGPGRVGVTIGTAIPLLLVAVGTIVSSQAGLINIGQEGQLAVGAAAAAYVGVELGGPGPLVVVALLAAGVVGGAIWAGIAAVLRYWRGVPEVLSTLLLVTLAAQLVGFGLKNQWLLLAPAEGRANRQQVSEQLSLDTRIPRITMFGNEFPISAFLALAIAAAIAFMLARTVWGARLQMLGRNQRASHRSGVSATRYGAGALLISGGFAGLAGGAMLAGGDFGNYTLVPGFPVLIGFGGLLVALVSQRRVSVAVIVSFAFAGLRTGSGFLAATGVERRITDVVQGLLVLALLLPPALLFIRERRRAVIAASDRN